MSKLTALQGKNKSYKIGKLELELKPLTLDEMSLFNIDQNASTAERMKISRELIAKVLKDSVPDATEAEINNIGMQYMSEIMDAIMDVNGLKEQRGTSAIKERLNVIKEAKSNKEKGTGTGQ